MSERDEPQINFRVNEEADKTDFEKALAKQDHISSATAFFQSCLKALVIASHDGDLVEWPIELVRKPRRK
jgi:hypothetical protein